MTAAVVGACYGIFLIVTALRLPPGAELTGQFALQPGGAVLDGRDIGTVIAPEAEVKLFVTASVEARAERRWKEMTERGETLSLEEIVADLKRRDERDRTREAAPLIAAADAIVLDTSGLNREAAIAEAIRLAEERLAATGATGV